MHNILLILSAIILFEGCSSKEQDLLAKSYNEKKEYHKKLQKTEKIQLYDSQVTKAMMTATYLFEQSSNKNDKRDEVFVVGIYAEDEESNFLNKSKYTLTLNSVEPKSIKLLDENDPLLKDISFVSDWSKFYLVKFPHTSSKSFKLIFESDTYGKGELNFAKVAKYVFTKKSF